jgi:hypothetical protein
MGLSERSLEGVPSPAQRGWPAGVFNLRLASDDVVRAGHLNPVRGVLGFLVGNLATRMAEDVVDIEYLPLEP